MLKVYYHTQEKRKNVLTLPIECIRDDAWLGEGTYFWKDELDSMNWGQTSKRGQGQFEIYEAEVEFDEILDTVFNEDHYNFWLRQIEKISKKIISLTHEKPTLKELNDYIKDKGIWKGITGIQFQDLPVTPEHMLVKPITYRNKKVRNVPFRKRIQLVVYNQNIISTFALNSTHRII